MGRTHKKVSVTVKRKRWTRVTAAEGVEQALCMLEGRWKFLILFQLFGGRVCRYSDLERAIPAVTQKMLAQQLRQMEKDGIAQTQSLSSDTSESGVFVDRVGTVTFVRHWMLC